MMPAANTTMANEELTIPTLTDPEPRAKYQKFAYEMFKQHEREMLYWKHLWEQSMKSPEELAEATRKTHQRAHLVIKEHLEKTGRWATREELYDVTRHIWEGKEKGRVQIDKSINKCLNEGSLVADASKKIGLPGWKK